MTWSGWQIKKNISLILKEFNENVCSKTPRCRKYSDSYMMEWCIVKVQRVETSPSISNTSPSNFKALPSQFYPYAAPLHCPLMLPSSFSASLSPLKHFSSPLTPLHRHLRLSRFPWRLLLAHTSPFNSSPSTLMLCHHHLTLFSASWLHLPPSHWHLMPLYRPLLHLHRPVTLFLCLLTLLHQPFTFHRRPLTLFRHPLVTSCRF